MKKVNKRRVSQFAIAAVSAMVAFKPVLAHHEESVDTFHQLFEGLTPLIDPSLITMDHVGLIVSIHSLLLVV